MITNVTIHITEQYFSSFSVNLFQGDHFFVIELTGFPTFPINSSEFQLIAYLTDIDRIRLETSVRQKLINWINIGVSMLSASTAFVSKQRTNLGILISKQCNRHSCPPISKCASGPREECIYYTTQQNCVEGAGCLALELTCVSSETLCVRPVGCDDCECSAEVEVCQEWESKCTQEGAECRTQEIVVSDECEDTLRHCEEEITASLDCVMECQWKSALIASSNEVLEISSAAHNATARELSGFETLNVIQREDFNAGELFVLDGIVGELVLDDTGVSGEDMEFTLTGRFISIEEKDLVTSDLQLSWDFYSRLSNVNQILTSIKAFVIENSEGTLTEDLIEKFPPEVSAENLDYLLLIE